jgi:hypothetical protein
MTFCTVERVWYFVRMEERTPARIRFPAPSVPVFGRRERLPQVILARRRSKTTVALKDW